MLTGLGFSPFYAAFICLIANTAPVAFGSLGIPVVTLRRKPGWIAGLTALGAAVVLAVGVYGMPVVPAAAAMVYGAAFGLFPIGWIVIASLILYRVTLDSGRLSAMTGRLCAFGGFIEGAAGFGTPVAIAAAMLTGLGFSPFYAAFICLIANTAPVAFGSLGIPVVTLAQVTGLPEMGLSAMTGCARSSASSSPPTWWW